MAKDDSNSSNVPAQKQDQEIRDAHYAEDGVDAEGNAPKSQEQESSED